MRALPILFANPGRKRVSTPCGLVAALLVLASVAPASAQSESDPSGTSGRSSAADRIRANLEPDLAALVDEVLERNPDLARLRASAAASEQRAPQSRALPDPMAGLTAFLSTPETRVGPQQASATISQRFPWFGKLRLREREALLRAAAARLEVEARRLEMVTETRRLVHELAFLEAEERVVREDRATLSHFEELARSRYASGVGLSQAVIKIQAEITKDDYRLLGIETRQASLQAALNALRDRAADESLPGFVLDGPRPEFADGMPETLLAVAREGRPEVARARLLLEATGVGIELAEKEYRPDVTVGLGYTLVGRRDDAPGRAAPPPGNGDDILGLTVGINLPVRRQKLEAAVLQASALESASREGLRSVLTAIQQSLGDLSARLPLTLDQLSLFEDLLLVQAEEALRSAETAYASGSQGALDFLDAERVLLDVRVASARALADSLVLVARLEGALGAPLTDVVPGDTP